jgi:hypothetical protein
MYLCIVAIFHAVPPALVPAQAHPRAMTYGSSPAEALARASVSRGLSDLAWHRRRWRSPGSVVGVTDAKLQRRNTTAFPRRA